MTADQSRPDWIAVDWGTSHLRLWRMSAAGDILQRIDSDKGMGRLSQQEFEPVLLDLLAPDLGADRPLTVICCGMVGSRQGWAEARYRAVPCKPPGLAEATVPDADPRLRVFLLPGLSQASPADVMRGEETQIAGFLFSEPKFDGVLCLPGTHCKWVHISAGEVVSFRTFMTGEMFELLSTQSVLRHSVSSSGFDAEAFSEAVDRTLSHPQALAGDLFALRAETLLAGLGAEAARARLSGLLIGAELGGARPYWLGRDVVVLGESGVAAAYARALESQGAAPRTVDPETMTLGGLRAAYAQMETSAT
ncbi:2-dehydro-3-deoxygalactonokinase [Sulfitobacter sp. D35]|uniref:2-dehydro-3-deoxygalactonokinase n=1 Tax=Sulfitobacter sp. D35 TaxID=3083252 RepID=UPI00296EE572|nr:2-dehydro-3-deoxygalactonokinase [Sulfitobacter sp. D35]MDW4497981.1 2-dehydro-3-deoxygalactonokinase [Sulfitobacter sp. D35]